MMTGHTSGPGHELIDCSSTGYIFDIQRYSINDGPGIRSTVFFKGCPLWCLWCSNPESQRQFPELLYHEPLCTKCYRCVEVCRTGATSRSADGSIALDRERCKACGECVKVCPAEARIIAGRIVTVGEVLDIVKRDSLFYRNSGGGVTASGGEPTNQPRFLTELLKGCREYGIHTALDTGGYVRWETLKRVLEFVDLVLYDIKHMDTQKHKEFTGVGNELIIKNARLIVQHGKGIIIRLPLIPGFNDSAEHLRAVSHFMGRLGVRRIDILPYHRLGMTKYVRLGREYKLPKLEACQEEYVQAIRDSVESYGLEVNIV